MVLVFCMDLRLQRVPVGYHDLWIVDHQNVRVHTLVLRCRTKERVGITYWLVVSWSQIWWRDL